MLGSIRSAITSLRASPLASSSRVTLAAFAQAPAYQNAAGPSSIFQMSQGQVRFRSQLAPKRTKYRKAQKGRVSIPTGGSIKGTSLEHATYGLRVLSSVRLTASQLTAAQVAIKRKIKPVKGAECFMRVFPDVPVCVKGNETRMGKGKGGFEYWACRVPVGRVVFEVGGGGIREEIARQALKLAQVKLPVPTEFITRASSPRLGSISSSALTPPPPALPVPAQLAELDAKDEGGAVDVIMRREEQRLVDGMAALDVGAGQSGVAAQL